MPRHRTEGGPDGIVAEPLDQRPHHQPRLVVGNQLPQVRRFGHVGRLNRLDPIAGIRQPAGRAFDRRRYRRMHRDTRDGCAVGHLDRARQCGALQRRRHPGRITDIGRRHRLQRDPQIADGAGQRPLDRHHRHRRRSLLGGTRIEIGNAPDRGPQAIDASAIGRIAHRACDVIAVRDRAHARGHCRRGTTARAARGVLTRPGVERAAMQVVVGEPAKRESRRVGATEDHRSGAPKVGHDRTVVGRHRITQGHDAVGGRAATLIDVHLGGHRHPVQHAKHLAIGDRPIGSIGSGECAVVQDLDDRIKPRIDLGHTLQTRLGRLAARNAVRADGVRQVGGRPAPERFGHGVSPFSLACKYPLQPTPGATAQPPRPDRFRPLRAIAQGACFRKSESSR